ncbi:VOC family protein [Glycomyces sp. MUSA5-2]|uniref:VOC family protein n=1 Tax=Glycomyces sp. MUSA5-2 TaxID=2053002 RepID=UPI0030091A03
MTGTRLTLTSITVTAPDPRLLADFYARLLGVPVAVSEPPRPGEPDSAGWAQVRTGDGLTLNFEYEAHWQAPVWPAQDDRPHATQHLDIHVDDLDTAVAHAAEQGARLADFQPQADVRVLFDPAGHPFCLFL